MHSEWLSISSAQQEQGSTTPVLRLCVYTVPLYYCGQKPADIGGIRRQDRALPGLGRIPKILWVPHLHFLQQSLSTEKEIYTSVDYKEAKKKIHVHKFSYQRVAIDLDLLAAAGMGNSASSKAFAVQHTILLDLRSNSVIDIRCNGTQ